MKKKYYSEDELIDKYQKGEIDWLEYVTGFSKEWEEEYEEFLKENNFLADNDSALRFLQHKEEMMEFAHQKGNF